MAKLNWGGRGMGVIIVRRVFFKDGRAKAESRGPYPVGAGGRRRRAGADFLPETGLDDHLDGLQVVIG